MGGHLRREAQRRLRRLHDPRGVVRLDALQDGHAAHSESSGEVRLDGGAHGQQEWHGGGVRAVQHHEAKDRVLGAGGTEVRRPRGWISSVLYIMVMVAAKSLT